MKEKNKKVEHKNLFVYGTLEHGQSRHQILENLKFKKARLLRHRKVSPPSLGFPFIISDENSEVEGEVYFELNDDLFFSLDLIEGEGSLYHRIIVEVLTNDGEKIQAYTYYPSDNLLNKFI